jgi:hypothetical protein
MKVVRGTYSPLYLLILVPPALLGPARPQLNLHFPSKDQDGIGGHSVARGSASILVPKLFL